MIKTAWAANFTINVVTIKSFKVIWLLEVVVPLKENVEILFKQCD